MTTVRFYAARVPALAARITLTLAADAIDRTSGNNTPLILSIVTVAFLSLPLVCVLCLLLVLSPRGRDILNRTGGA